jgi:hypothetical protein
LTIQLLAFALLAWALIRRCTMNARPAAVADATRTPQGVRIVNDDLARIDV